jgi:hypothetical protein
MMLCPKPELKAPPPGAFPPFDVLPPKILPPAENKSAYIEAVKSKS